MTEPAHRAGLVAILGRPNAGKSTLLNRLLGEKLAIVTAKPQTTRSRILGILTLGNAQVLLLDTPGMHESQRSLNLALNAQVEEAAADCDVALVLVDPRGGWDEGHTALVAGLARRGTPVVAALTKADLRAAESAAWPPEGVDGVSGWHRISARTGSGLEPLVEDLAAGLPESPALYPEDQLSDRPVRFLAVEELAQELPYCVAIEVVTFDETDPAITRIRANIVVERATQKPMVIGRGGAVIKKIGSRARVEIERLLGNQVHLALWVKVEPRWQKRAGRLESLGYS